MRGKASNGKENTITGSILPADKQISMRIRLEVTERMACCGKQHTAYTSTTYYCYSNDRGGLAAGLTRVNGKMKHARAYPTRPTSRPLPRFSAGSRKREAWCGLVFCLAEAAATRMASAAPPPAPAPDSHATTQRAQPCHCNGHSSSCRREVRDAMQCLIPRPVPLVVAIRRRLTCPATPPAHRVRATSHPHPTGKSSSKSSQKLPRIFAPQLHIHLAPCILHFSSFFMLSPIASSARSCQ